MLAWRFAVVGVQIVGVAVGFALLIVGFIGAVVVVNLRTGKPYARARDAQRGAAARTVLPDRTEAVQ